ncbi:hypothetical protein HPO96_11090 [Kribbella sandramycini]|uniref:DUF5666 domain-containing protein n=1 Tax=Kribbella sandramycini TaxID=60450 RepID=A0A7Y4P059_9ACTN|nr:hypothetical protein [Kribbella sandramycini]MBB6569372.1 hypothetical protein [Kribbella sandramycini]NOL40790.1 hypothetical protein [Kribbella sandramycini]
MALFQKMSDKSWRIAGTIAAVAVTTTAGGVAWAATNADPTPSPSASPSAPANPGEPGKGPGRGFGHPGQFGGALHGEFVVPKEGGGYQTVATQRGEVTAVSKDSLTVKSEDGYSRTYTLNAETLVNSARDGIASVKTGSTVNVAAVVADGKATAVRVNDGAARKAAGEKWGWQRGPR